MYSLYVYTCTSYVLTICAHVHLMYSLYVHTCTSYVLTIRAHMYILCTHYMCTRVHLMYSLYVHTCTSYVLTICVVSFPGPTQLSVTCMQYFLLACGENLGTRLLYVHTCTSYVLTTCVHMYILCTHYMCTHVHLMYTLQVHLYTLPTNYGVYLSLTVVLVKQCLVTTVLWLHILPWLIGIH